VFGHRQLSSRCITCRLSSALLTFEQHASASRLAPLLGRVQRSCGRCCCAQEAVHVPAAAVRWVQRHRLQERQASRVHGEQESGGCPRIHHGWQARRTRRRGKACGAPGPSFLAALARYSTRLALQLSGASPANSEPQRPTQTAHAPAVAPLSARSQTCRGSGVQVHLRPLGPGMMQQIQSRCSTCSGSGYNIPPCKPRGGSPSVCAAGTTSGTQPHLSATNSSQRVGHKAVTAGRVRVQHIVLTRLRVSSRAPQRTSARGARASASCRTRRRSRCAAARFDCPSTLYTPASRLEQPSSTQRPLPCHAPSPAARQLSSPRAAPAQPHPSGPLTCSIRVLPLQVHIEAGMKHGSRITLRGEAGCSEPGLLPGDIILVILQVGPRPTGRTEHGSATQRTQQPSRSAEQTRQTDRRAPQRCGCLPRRVHAMFHVIPFD
jgi:hypothetical protein